MVIPGNFGLVLSEFNELFSDSIAQFSQFKQPDGLPSLAAVILLLELVL